MAQTNAYVNLALYSSTTTSPYIGVSASLPQGDIARISASFTDLSGNFIDPDTVNFLFQYTGKPQTTYTYPGPITKLSTGVYYAFISCSQPNPVGLVTYRFQSSGFGQTTTGDQTFTIVPSIWGG